MRPAHLQTAPQHCPVITNCFYDLKIVATLPINRNPVDFVRAMVVEFLFDLYMLFFGRRNTLKTVTWISDLDLNESRHSRMR